jgi:molecular chaperone GrpE
LATVKKKRRIIMANKKQETPNEEPKVTKLPMDEESFDALIKENEKIGEELDAALAAGAAVKTELDEEKDRYLRLMAEYDNYKRRTQREKTQIYSDAKADTLTAFLPMIDNLKRAAASPADDGAAMKKGVEMILTQAAEILTGCGIEEIEALGQPFDPTVHNAVLHIDDENYGEQEVVEVFETGYKIGDKVIRHAMVKVAN